MKISELLEDQGSPFRTWKKQVINKFSAEVKFQNDVHGGGTVNRNTAILNGKVVAVFNRKNGQGTIFSEGH